MTHRGTLVPEVTKAGPICMNQYKYLFGITRVPTDGCDTLNGSYPPTSKHITVFIDNQIYKCLVYDGDRMMSADEIKA